MQINSLLESYLTPSLPPFSPFSLFHKFFTWQDSLLPSLTQFSPLLTRHFTTILSFFPTSISNFLSNPLFLCSLYLHFPPAWTLCPFYNSPRSTLISLSPTCFYTCILCMYLFVTTQHFSLPSYLSSSEISLQPQHPHLSLSASVRCSALFSVSCFQPQKINK